MKKTILISLILCSFIFLLSLTSCSQVRVENNIPSITDEIIPLKYIESMGYEIVSEIEKVDSKIISKNDLKGSFLNGRIWSVQSFPPEKIIGKNVEYYCVNVRNHPLDTFLSYEDESIKITILKSNNKIIGGYSIINYKELRFGFGVYSIDGKTLEECTGQDFQTWRKNWDKKYK